MMNCVVVNLRSWLCLLCLFFAACGSSPEPLPDGGVTVDSGVNVCRCDVSRACEAGCACDRDCGGGCGCDVSRACDDGCACDADCRGGCACDVGPGCDCGCDPDCTMELCSDTCEYQGDGECDDGGPGSATDLCAFGTDCSDCGSRTPACEPDCSGRECGGDGCGGSCGSGCAPADTCVDFRCVSCACDTSSACDAGCESCDPDCCVEPDRPSTVATAWVNASVVSEEPVRQSGATALVTGYSLVAQQRDVPLGAREVNLNATSNDCVVTAPAPPPSCERVVVSLTDGAIAQTEVDVSTVEDAPGEACGQWVRQLASGSFTVECTRGFLTWAGVCSSGGPEAMITDRWSLRVLR